MKVEALKMKNVYKALIKSYRNNKKFNLERSSLLGFYFFRKVSLVITPLFIALRCSANSVTLFSLLVGVLGAFLFCLGSGYFLPAFFCILLAQMLDYVDGNVARLHGRTSYYGKFIDGLSDSMWKALTFIGIGIGLYNSKTTFHALYSCDKSNFLILGALLCFLELFSTLSEVRFMAMKNELSFKSQGDLAPPQEKHTGNKYLLNFVKFYLRIKMEMFFIPLFVTVIINKVHWFLLAIFVYEIGYFILASLKVLAKARKELNYLREF